MPEAKTWGKDFDFFRKETVPVNPTNPETGAGWTEEAQVVFNFRGQVTFSLVNEGDQVIEYSFNGNVLHGDLTPLTPTQAIFFDNRRVSRIWFRSAYPGQLVRVEAWASIF